MKLVFLPHHSTEGVAGRVVPHLQVMQVLILDVDLVRKNGDNLTGLLGLFFDDLQDGLQVPVLLQVPTQSAPGIVILGARNPPKQNARDVALPFGPFLLSAMAGSEMVLEVHGVLKPAPVLEELDDDGRARGLAVEVVFLMQVDGVDGVEVGELLLEVVTVGGTGGRIDEDGHPGPDEELVLAGRFGGGIGGRRGRRRLNGGGVASCSGGEGGFEGGREGEGGGEVKLEEAGEGAVVGLLGALAGAGGADSGGVLEEVLELVVLFLLAGAEWASKGAVGVADPMVTGLQRLVALLLVVLDLRITHIRVLLVR